MARRFRVKPIKTKSKNALSKVKDRIPTSEEEEEPSAPRITNDTVAEHREDVLSGGRRFLYPLQHSKHRVVIISSLLIGFLLISIIVLSYLMLYRWQNTNNFAYRITQIFPVPIARVDGTFVPYERYLFELNSAVFYFENHAQEGIDINGDEGRQVIAESKVQALEKAKLDVLAEKIARENNIVISDAEIEAQISLIRNQGGIGESNSVLQDVLSDFYDWDVSDLRTVVRTQLIRQKIPRVLDTETRARAEAVLERINNGEKLGDIAEETSDDALTRESRGIIGLISRTNTDLPPEFIEATFELDEGETTTELVESAFGLHIIRVNKNQEDQKEVAHILFQYFNINDYLKDRLNEVEVSDYITL